MIHKCLSERGSGPYLNNVKVRNEIDDDSRFPFLSTEREFG